METIGILVCYNGKWVTLKKMCTYEGGDSKGIIVSRTITFAEILDRGHKISNTNIREDKLCLKFSVPVSSNECKHIKIDDNNDILFFIKYNCDVLPAKVVPFLVSIEDRGVKNLVGDSMHITMDSSRMAPSSVAIIESNEVIGNTTNVGHVSSDVGTEYLDTIDFTDVEEMHGDDIGT
ncbi:hypothetical protein L3X38_036418 [Prunus dulcis]|uniref:Uncharacterized protein n=1 Tax=Prunus dulcis TaxID=3755 RepID=A0AAD4V3A5_PRUDU|nr:hypothetical protein L3X38_036418 [Prunus dulcis]